MNLQELEARLMDHIEGALNDADKLRGATTANELIQSLQRVKELRWSDANLPPAPPAGEVDAGTPEVNAGS